MTGKSHFFGDLTRDGSSDFDSDGSRDRDEFLAGTDPTNTGSVFRVIAVTALGGGPTRLMWNGTPSRSYRVEYKDELGNGAWNVLSIPIVWSGTTAGVIDAASASNRFYRVVMLP